MSKALRNLVEASELSPGDKGITDALTKLKKSLNPDPGEALKAFKDLRVSIDKEKQAEQRARDALPGRIIIRTLPNGQLIIEDHP